MTGSARGRSYRSLIVLVGVLISVHTNLDAQPVDSTTTRVLALHVVRRDSPGFDDAFRTVLRDAIPDRLDYYSEYIDLNRLGEPKYQAALRAYLRARYVDDGFDLVIASGPSVVDFLNSDPSLFEGVPIV